MRTLVRRPSAARLVTLAATLSLCIPPAPACAVEPTRTAAGLAAPTTGQATPATGQATPATADAGRSLGSNATTALADPGWEDSSGAWRYRLANGSFAEGWLADGGAWYYFVNGAMHRGWAHIGGSWYYFGRSGAMATGWAHVDGAWYWLGSQGRMTTGWFHDGSHWYHANATGRLTKRWYPEGNAWYYLGDDGAMRVGWAELDGTWYHFGASGAMSTGWFATGGQWYLADYTGALVHGWRYSDGAWHYLDDDSGAMARGTITLSGLRFTLDAAGRLTGATTQTLRVPNLTPELLCELNQNQWTEVKPWNVQPGDIDAGGLLQFKDLSEGNPEGVTAAMVDDFIARNCIYMEDYLGCRSSLRDQGAAFVEAAELYGVNVVYLVCHTSIETGWGCSDHARGELWEDPLDPSDVPTRYYTYFGYGAVDSDPYNGGMRYAKEHGWTSPAAAIWGGVKAISEEWMWATGRTPQKTLYEMRWDPVLSNETGKQSWHEYATDPTFATAIGDQMATFYRQEGLVPTLNLRVPIYG